MLGPRREVRVPVDAPNGAGRSGPAGMSSGVTRGDAGSHVVGAAGSGSLSSGDLRAESSARSRRQVLTVGCEPLTHARPRGLSVTYWFDAATEGDPYQVSIRFTGKHVGSNQKIGAAPARIRRCSRAPLGSICLKSPRRPKTCRAVAGLMKLT